jgi:hypothetical protein
MTFPQDSWFDIFENSQQFLYKLIKYDNPMPAGNTVVQADESYNYSISPNPNSTYCWSVEGGSITADNGDEITVIWNEPVTMGSVSVQEVNYFSLRGEANPLIVNISSSLPLVWNSFSGKQNGADIHLTWEVGSEVNLSHYKLERASDGQNFSTILKQEGKGDFINKSSYEFMDKQPLKGMNYYRLQAVDKDGQSTYSKVIAIDVVAFFELKLWINSDLQLFFYGEDIMENIVQVIDLQGRVILQKTFTSIKGWNEWKIPFSHMSSGVYVLKIRNQNGEQVKKFFVD